MPATRPSFLKRMLGTSPDPRHAMRPLWHKVVQIAREPQWYADCGVADTVPGRFDMITAVLSLVVLRMEGERELQVPSAHLIELFVADMDGQLRELGINDVVVGKHMGRLMSTLGGRMGAYREGLKDGGTDFIEAVRRNVSLEDQGRADILAERLQALAVKLRETSDADLLKGAIAL
ncbi:ubiquinol-cytochrome C chaperone family protein [Porphyrobacter sp. GA68]|uniref:ubiquinol-cytochrome C chaperone family protein n=1 Tax=Porphyrobacter sp. GA68 TaxID=2883480 RepID=UPI001D190CC8|nr:ubiquinol-cytochrome C chaperone family protein [Porphyrobacter sp. GA68]